MATKRELADQRIRHAMGAEPHAAHTADEPDESADWDRTEWNTFFVTRSVGWVRLTPTGWAVRFDEGEPCHVDPAIGEALFAAACGCPADFMACLLRTLTNALAGDGVLRMKV